MSQERQDFDEVVEAAKENLIAAESMRRNGDFDGAMDECLKVIDRPLETGPMRNLLLFHAYVCRGSALSGKGEHAQAIDDFSRAIQIDPENSSAYFHRGMAWEQSGEIDQALDDYARALRLDPDNDDVRVRQAQAESQKNDD